MTKISCLVIAISLTAIQSLYSQTDVLQPKLSPSTQLFLKDIQQTSGIPSSYVYRKDSKGNACVAGMIKITPGIDIEAIADAGVQIGTKAGQIWTVSIPVEQMEAFTKIKGIVYIELDLPIAPDMDAARTVTRTDSVHGGYAPLTNPFTGKNVVVGIIDAGFDYNHPNMKDTSGNNWRIKKIWEQKSTGTPPTGFSYGNEITSTTTMQTTGTDLVQFSHGAHVAGIAAGSGYGSSNNNLYRGIAYESDMVFVGITPDSTQWMNTGMSDIIDGMNYIYSYAASVSKPAVANLSWGCTVGPHDGNSLFSQACDALTGKGKIFVCSAGNNGTNSIHLAKTFTTSDTIIRTELVLNTSLKNTWVDIWGDTLKGFCTQVSLYNGSTETASTGFICLNNATNSFALVGSDNDTCFVDIVTEASSFNNKPRSFLRFYNKSNNRIMLSAKGTDGTIDMWTGYVQKTRGYYGSFSSGLPNTLDGNAIMSVGDMASTRSAIAVASFASKINFTNIAGNPISYSSYVSSNGRLAPYSSRGPSADFRTKPDIAAPGLMIGSSVSIFDDAYKPSGGSADHVVASYLNPSDGKTYYYAMLTGTSMSSPVVAGVVSLMLQANPGLYPSQVMEILKTTALHDTYTGPATANGNYNWGHGKVNAFAAVAKAIQYLHTNNIIAVSPDIQVYPNPSNGSFVIQYDCSKQNEQIEIIITDITGKLISSQQMIASAGRNAIPCNMQGISGGMYMIMVKSPSHGSKVLKLVME
ncbi:hypothetical protein CAP35_10960 [Chitinophagaceae bacterium IBVUCB1]|nr:hypothetical protein CAP35_10960 [Chitinophagaceae bacterium IBVUCB1]